MALSQQVWVCHSLCRSVVLALTLLQGEVGFEPGLKGTVSLCCPLSLEGVVCVSWRTASLGDPFQPLPCAIQGYRAEQHCCSPGFVVRSFIIL